MITPVLPRPLRIPAIGKRTGNTGEQYKPGTITFKITIRDILLFPLFAYRA